MFLEVCTQHIGYTQIDTFMSFLAKMTKMTKTVKSVKMTKIVKNTVFVILGQKGLFWRFFGFPLNQLFSAKKVKKGHF